MFKSNFICASAQFEPVKEAETGKPSIELVAELIKIQLKELGFYAMVGVKYAHFGVAYGNMHPRQDFPHIFFVIHDDCLMGGCRSVLLHGGIDTVAVPSHGGVTVSPLTDFAGKGGKP